MLCVLATALCSRKCAYFCALFRCRLQPDMTSKTLEDSLASLNEEHVEVLVSILTEIYTFSHNVRCRMSLSKHD